MFVLESKNEVSERDFDFIDVHWQYGNLSAQGFDVSYPSGINPRIPAGQYNILSTVQDHPPGQRATQVSGKADKQVCLVVNKELSRINRANFRRQSLLRLPVN
jgi:hypothetical protein